MTLPTGRALLDPERILTEAGLSLGETYADFGAGTLGHFVLPASAMVGKSGRVYAVDILPGALSGVEGRARSEGAVNLTTVWGDLEHPQGTKDIPEASVDLVSLVNVAGLLKKSGNTLKNALRVLKPNGRLLVVDWDKAGTPVGPPVGHRHNPEEVQPIAEAAGFKVEKSFRAGPHHWGLLFHR